MTERKRHTPGMDLAYTIGRVALMLVLAAALGCRKEIGRPSVAVPASPPVNQWLEAAKRIEEAREGAVGRRASVTVPDELKHYPDRRRFLGIQAAATLEQGYEIPEDFADLVRLIRQGEFVEIKPLGDDYILYGVGEIETDEPIVHYDRESGLGVPLLATDAEYESELARITGLGEELAKEISDGRAQLKSAGRRQRALRSRLRVRLKALDQSLLETDRRKELLKNYFTDPQRRRLLALEYESLVKFAAGLDDGHYNLAAAESRREFKVRLLGFARPEAKTVIEQIARTYNGKFSRRLPVTSLVRTEEYQRRLARKNTNAARSVMPPHATGLAFDLYYYFMDADEQIEVMSQVAMLESAGQVEALRESRDNIHVFAFAAGRPPGELLVEQALPARNSRARIRQRHPRSAAAETYVTR